MGLGTAAEEVVTVASAMMASRLGSEASHLDSESLSLDSLQTKVLKSKFFTAAHIVSEALMKKISVE